MQFTGCPKPVRGTAFSAGAFPARDLHNLKGSDYAQAINWKDNFQYFISYAEIQFVYSISSDLGNILYGFYTDLPPSDNNLVIDLN